MSKYNHLWEWIKENKVDNFKLSFDETEAIAGFAIDHSFLIYKKELEDYGFKVGKISLKEKEIFFEKTR